MVRISVRSVFLALLFTPLIGLACQDPSCQLTGIIQCPSKQFTGSASYTASCNPPSAQDPTRQKDGLLGKSCTEVDKSTVGGGVGKCVALCTCKGETDTEGNPLMDPMMMPMEMMPMMGGMPPMLPMLPMKMPSMMMPPMPDTNSDPCKRSSILGNFFSGSNPECPTEKKPTTTPATSQSIFGNIFDRLTNKATTTVPADQKPGDVKYLGSDTTQLRPLRSETTVQASPQTGLNSFGGSTFQSGSLQTPTSPATGIFSSILGNLSTGLTSLMTSVNADPSIATQQPGLISSILQNVRSILGSLFSAL